MVRYFGIDLTEEAGEHLVDWKIGYKPNLTNLG
jgi:hypothetical protein